MTADQSKSIEKFYLEMYNRLFVYAYSSLKNDSLAEEAIQEAFRIVCQKPEEFLTSPNPRGWIVNTLKYTIQKIKRNQNKANVLIAQYTALHSDADVFVEDRVNLEVMYENVIKSEEFQLIKEMAVEGRSHLEMAQARGISVDACKKRVQRAKEFLKKNI